MMCGRKHPRQRMAGSHVHPLLPSAPFRSHESPLLIGPKYAASHFLPHSPEQEWGKRWKRGKWGRGEWRPVKHEWGTDVALAQHRRAEFPSLKYKRWFADQKSHTLAGRACSLGRDVWGLKKKKLAAIHNKFCIYMCNLCSSTCVIPFPSTTLSTKHITKKSKWYTMTKEGNLSKLLTFVSQQLVKRVPPL